MESEIGSSSFRHGLPESSLHGSEQWLGHQMLRRICFLALLLASPTTVRAESGLTPSNISEQIAAIGAHQTLEAICSNQDRWSQLLAGIASGTKGWLTIAIQLYPASDAGTSEQLALAIGEALEHKPENVLSLAVDEFGIEAICGGPDVDDQRFNSYSLSMATIAKRQKMLRAMKGGELRHDRDSCIAALEKAKQGIANFYGVKK
jgi:hypothetical protein